MSQLDHSLSLLHWLCKLAQLCTWWEYEDCASLQALYSYATSTSAANAPADRPAVAASLAMLPELHVEGFDAEQVWLQLDMASAQLVRRAKRLLKKAGPEPSLLTPETEEDLSGQHIALPMALQSSSLVLCPACTCIWGLLGHLLLSMLGKNSRWPSCGWGVDWSWTVPCQKII